MISKGSVIGRNRAGIESLEARVLAAADTLAESESTGWMYDNHKVDDSSMPFVVARGADESYVLGVGVTNWSAARADLHFRMPAAFLDSVGNTLAGTPGTLVVRRIADPATRFTQAAFGGPPAAGEIEYSVVLPAIDQNGLLFGDTLSYGEMDFSLPLQLESGESTFLSFTLESADQNVMILFMNDGWFGYDPVPNVQRAWATTPSFTGELDYEQGYGNQIYLAIAYEATVLLPVPGAPVVAAEPEFTAGLTNTVSWGTVAGADEYYMEWSTSSEFAAVGGNSGWIVGTSAIASGLIDGSTQYFRVKARNAAGESAWSNVVSSTQDATAPAVPVVSAVSDDTGISGSDRITSDRTLILSGTADAGTSVNLFRDGTPIGNTIATAAGTWAFDYTATSLGDGSYSFTATASDTVENTSAVSAPYGVTVETTAPTVTAVYVRGSSWAAGYLSFLAANMSGSSATYGYAIPVGTGAAQLQTLPWRNLNRISIAFGEDVSVAQAQFAIVGSIGSYSVSGFSYSSADHVATWSLAAAIGPDRLYVALPGSGSTPVKDVAGNILDGEWNNPSSYSDASSTDTFPSGNGVAGGDFAFRFDVLPGDSSGGSLGKVNVADVAQTKSRSSLPVSLSTYRSDFDGNNLVNVADVAYVKSKSSVYSLPVNPPVLPMFGPVFSRVRLLQKNRSLNLL